MAANEKPIAVAFEGPLGSGKGTQVELFLERRNDVRCIGVSGAIRHLAKAAPQYSYVLEIMNSGGLVPDHAVIQAVEVSLVENSVPQKKVTFLDGIPRSLTQAKYLVEDLSRFYELHIILLHLEDEECIRRAKKRRDAAMLLWSQSDFDETKKPAALRDDDKEEVVIERLRLYREIEREIKSYLILNSGNVAIHLLPADSHPEMVFEEIHSRVFA